MTSEREPPPVLPHIVQQHAEEAALLRHARAGLVRAPHVGLELLGRHDERIEAHLDGLLTAGTAGKRMAQQQLLEDVGEAGASFSAAVLALRQGDRPWLNELLAASADAGCSRRGLAAALGWVAPEDLRGVVRQLLNSDEPSHRQLGIEACRMHQVDPGDNLANALADTDAPLRAAAWRCAGELGRRELLDAARAALSDCSPEVVFWAAWAACLLGESLSWITGADLARDGLDTLTALQPPERPGDDPDDEEVSLDEDDDLLLPDVAKLRAWWASNREMQAAAAAGTRLFAGAGIDSAAAWQVLREGSQRMRWLAALWLCVLQPGRALFPVAAPAARQRRLLAAEVAAGAQALRPHPAPRHRRIGIETRNSSWRSTRG